MRKYAFAVTSAPAIKVLRQGLRLARTRVDICLNGADRMRRRRFAKEFAQQNPEDVATSGSAPALSRTGFANWPLAAGIKSALVSSWQEISQRRASGGGNIERSTGKRFFEESLSFEDLRSHPILTSVALDERLLHVVMLELGMLPHLESVEVVVSRPTHGPFSASQLWHRDINDRRILKLFVYLGNVGDEQGPFTYLTAAQSAAVRRNGVHYLSDERIHPFAPEDSWQRVKGPEGTAFIIDTGRCYHCGSRCSVERVAYIATFSCGIKYMKYASRWREILDERLVGMTSLQRAVCDIAN